MGFLEIFRNVEGFEGFEGIKRDLRGFQGILRDFDRYFKAF